MGARTWKFRAPVHVNGSSSAAASQHTERTIMKLTKTLLPGIAVLAAAGLIATVTPAVADPSPAAFRTYAAVGSDTIDPVWNALSNGSGAPIPVVASYDAFGSATIQTKSGGATFNRPAGSTEGVKALSAAWDPTYSPRSYGGAVLNSQEVDFARSSSGPVAGSGLTYLPFARDAVSIVFRTSGSLTGVSLSIDELKEIYSGVDPSAAADQVVTTGTGAGATVTVNGVAVHPKIPQQGSGTRSFFLGAIGNPTLAGYISDPATGGLAENDGTVLTTAGDLIPFSAAAWIKQANTSAAGTSGNEIATVNGQAPTTGTVPNLLPGALFGATSGSDFIPRVAATYPFARDTYNVVPTAFLTGTTAQQALVSRLTSAGTSLAKGVDHADSKAIIRSYGLGTLAYVNDSATWLTGNWRH